MNHVETVDASVEPAVERLGVYPKSIRPAETEADLIAAAAPYVYGYGAIRGLFELLDDDERRLAHDLERCGICDNDDPYGVSEREQMRKQAMIEYEVEWDPTIRL